MKTWTFILGCFCGGFLLPLHSAEPSGELISKEGKVEFSRARAEWSSAEVGQKLVVQDRLRTREKSRAMLRLAAFGRMRVNEMTTVELLPSSEKDKKRIDLKAGALYFFTREQPDKFFIDTPHVSGASRGTEFEVSVTESETRFTVFDGLVSLSNRFGAIELAAGEQAAAEPGKAPYKTSVLQAQRRVQWWLYYPAVLSLEEIGLRGTGSLKESIEAYGRGNLIRASELYSFPGATASPEEMIYAATLLLAVGQVEDASRLLERIPASDASTALKLLIASVRGEEASAPSDSVSPSLHLASSYYLQSQYDLEGALLAARKSTELAPGFGFAWTRVGELEFSFGRHPAARSALRKALELSPDHAQARALLGFMLAAENKQRSAEKEFQKAVTLDPGLGNAWLGRGLLKIRKRKFEEGRHDLQTAAAMEPDRSILRSYLAKAFQQEHLIDRAEKELKLAKNLDPQDPTPYLYSALLSREENRINEAVVELEKSVELNENRQVYRSRMLLDQDRAVRGAGLADIYRRAGMNEVSLREAARSVAADYSNPSAHLFLADSFNALRDPTRFNLRYETPWLNELLLANLLSHAGPNPFQPISFQEYSGLFEAERFGLRSLSEYRSDGQFREIVSQYGSYGPTSYSLDLDYEYHKGFRPNNHLSRMEWYSQLKHQLSPQDSIFLLAKYQDYESEDNFQRYRAGQFRPDFRFSEKQDPILIGGYHREWSPGNHTLFLAGRLVNEQRFSDLQAPQLVLTRDPSGRVVGAGSILMDVELETEFETYTSELNQIFERGPHTFVFGTRLQAGQFSTRDQLRNPGAFPDFFTDPAAASRFEESFQRYSFYAYDTWEIVRDLFFTAGLSYDYLEYPRNFRNPPAGRGDDSRDRFNPKAGVIYSPFSWLTFRGAYARSLGGVSFDESFRLEPTQLAGFSQSFRSIIPESIVGSLSAPSFDIAGLGVDLKLRSRTYLGLEANWLESDADRAVGAFDYDGTFPPPPPTRTSSTREKLDYRERSLALTLNQLLGEEWAVGAGYRFTQSELERRFPEVPTAVTPGARTRERADMHQLRFHALYHHRSGFFSRAETDFYMQENRGYDPELHEEYFPLVNFYIGYRFPRQRGEIMIGVLNLLGENYHLNPLNLYSEFPREETFLVRVKFNF